MDKKIRVKMFMALVCVIVAFAVLGGVSFAWLTISTDPEIEGITANLEGGKTIQVSLNNVDYELSKQIRLNSYAPLIPVSTTDGLNWFVCKYDGKGDVIQEADPDRYQGSQYMYLRFPDGGNVSKNATIPVKKNLGNTSSEIASYYIYADIYLKTENEETDVYLSLPSSSTYEDDAQTTEKNHYGTYVLSYSYDENAKEVTALSKASDTTVRVGLMVLGTVDDGEEEGTAPAEPLEITHPEYFYVTSNYDDPDTTDIKDSNPFFIYEPNSDSRSMADKTSENYNTDMYIVGFKANTFYSSSGSNLAYEEADGYYLQTYPVALTEATFAKIKTMLNGTAQGCEPLYSQWLITGQDIGSGNKADGIISTFPVSRLIVQKTSRWKDSAGTIPQVETGSGEGEETTKYTELEDLFNSTQVGVMGAFLDTSTPTVLSYVETPGTTLNADYTAVDVLDINQQYRCTPKLTTLKKGEPKKIRMYFWIEGQDVDCWNDVSITDFLVNLEFVGDVQKN